MAEGCSTVRRMDSLPQYRTDNFRMVDKQEVGTWLSCRQTAPMRAPRLWFDADMVVHGSANPLLAAEIAFSCLHGNVAEKELDLIQFSACCVT